MSSIGRRFASGCLSAGQASGIQNFIPFFHFDRAILIGPAGIALFNCVL
jgi:hypothetical protein